MNGRITPPTLPGGRLSATRLPAMSDVALLAKVSAQTVSRVLAAHPHVSSQTRARVLAAVEQLGYRPNGAARALATGRTRTLGVFTLETNSYSRATVHHGIEVGARERATSSARPAPRSSARVRRSRPSAGSSTSGWTASSSRCRWPTSTNRSMS